MQWSIPSQHGSAPGPLVQRLTLLAASSFALLPACGGGGSPEPTREPTRPVKTATFGLVRERTSYSYPGRVHPDKSVERGFEVGGRLESLPVTKGQQVEKGQVLAQLDQRDYSNNLARAEAVRAQNAATLDRLQQAASSGAVAQQQVDEASAALQVAEASVAIAQKAFEDTVLRADFDGVVADRYFDNFQNVIAKEPVLALHDVSVLEVRIDIPERDIARAGALPADERSDLVASFSALPGRSYPLTVKEFVTEADPVTQTYSVILMTPAPEDGAILPGMSATVVWRPPVRPGAGRTLPLDAIVGLPGETGAVWLVAGGLAARRDVELGTVVDGDQVEILSGLEVGEVVATAGVHFLREGMQVRPLD